MQNIVPEKIKYNPIWNGGINCYWKISKILLLIRLLCLYNVQKGSVLFFWTSFLSNFQEHSRPAVEVHKNVCK